MTTQHPGAIILAGGDGTRIGIPKLMLRAGNESFLARIVRILHEANVAPVIVVAAAHYDIFVQNAAPDARFVAIEDSDAPMLTSLQSGLRMLDSLLPMLIVPVDHPFVNSSTIRTIIECAQREPMCIIKPKHRDASGHPILIPIELIPLILEAGGTTTLRDIIHNSTIHQQFVEVDDPGILRNINTRSDLDSRPS